MNTFFDGRVRGEGAAEDKREPLGWELQAAAGVACSCRVTGATQLSGSEVLIFWPPLNQEREAPILLNQASSGALFTVFLWSCRLVRHAANAAV